ncbi:hypothetical protein [Bacillus sp. 2205SS5-2]|uniref:hypothetical protein n=1 Tax=Bacillus sp. 2205SS5-2 TaxID=3109031 RepID=UPI003006EA91
MNTVNVANSSDRDKIENFLMKAGLSVDGVLEEGNPFFIMKDEQEKIVGTLGIEIQAKKGLLRSLAIAPAVPEQDLFTLFETARMDSRERGLSTIYLATNKATSVALFQFLGFELLDASALQSELSHFTYLAKLENMQSTFLMKCELK